MTSRPIQFWFRKRIVAVDDVAVQRTVLQWLREDMHACGSKEGCGEGDCGACTVAVGSLDAGAPGGVRIEAINSCIALLPSLDGKALFTVEDLADGDKLHPVQQALVDCHGSQCGFCTPGFAMSLWADYENRIEAPTRSEATEVLSGNLCRCTGYRPIIDAATAARALPPCRMDRAPLRRALESLASLPPLEYAHEGQRFIAPRTLDALGELFQHMPNARLLAGSTDIGLWVTKQLRQLGDIIYLGAIAELKLISVDADWLHIGAGASLTEAFAALSAEDPQWQTLARRFASPPVRNAGTLGGNVANGSPIGDSMPGLIALGARILMQRGAEQRELALEDFYIAYQRTALLPGEFVLGLRVPRQRSGRLFRTWKVSKRQDQDISAVCAAMALELDEAGSITQARLAFGGMAATPKRARAAEACLSGHGFTAASVQAAMHALAADFQPLDDMRASTAYRLQTARNLLWRLWLEHSGTQPVSMDEVEAT